MASLADDRHRKNYKAGRFAALYAARAHEDVVSHGGFATVACDAYFGAQAGHRMIAMASAMDGLANKIRNRQVPHAA